MVYVQFVTENAINVHYIKRKLTINMQVFVVSEVSSCPYGSGNVNNGTET